MGPVENTDKEIWRENSEDAFSPSIHVTKDGKIGINVGGTVIEMPVRDWHNLATGGGWTNARIQPPEQGGRYWCIVEEKNDLGCFVFQWNCGYDYEKKEWFGTDSDGGRVVYWRPLASLPPLLSELI